MIYVEMNRVLPLPWWERAGARGSIPYPPPPRSSPIKGEDNLGYFPQFLGDEPIMKNLLVFHLPAAYCFEPIAL